MSDPIVIEVCNESLIRHVEDALNAHTKRHSLLELSQALASGEGPASLYELLRRAH